MEKLNNHITKLQSRQLIKPAAVQPVVMATPALGRFRRRKKMDQLEPISIAIIGGADGPTSIYISKQSLWMLIIEIFICIAIFIFAIYGLIRSIKKKKIIKSVVCGIIILLVILPVIIFGVKRHKNLKEYQKFYENLGLSEEKPNLGIYTETEDFEYFKRNNKIINVDVDFAGTKTRRQRI